jgi:hypothetical protein
MLSKESAEHWYDRIIQNHDNGTCEQKVLGLRRIFDSVLLEMFPNISEQAFYRARVDEIFNSKKLGKTKRSDYLKTKREFHLLREYLNNIQHSVIEADSDGYIQAVRRLSQLINFCSGIEIPSAILSIYKAECHNISNETTSKPKENKLTLCLIVDRRHLDSVDVLQGIEFGITKIKDETKNYGYGFVVLTLKDMESVLAFPYIGKKNRFSFQSQSNVELVRPLNDYLINASPSKLYLFYLSNAACSNSSNIVFNIKDISLFMKIGIIPKEYQGLYVSHNTDNFDKLIKEDNLPQLFEWIVSVLKQE